MALRAMDQAQVPAEEIILRVLNKTGRNQTEVAKLLWIKRGSTI
jgi:DNA-binding protein Fis